MVEISGAGLARALPPLTIRPATREDIATFSYMENKPSIRAWVAERDGRLLGLAGVVFASGRWLAFCDLTEDMRPHKIVLARAAIRFLAECRKDGLTFIYAEADPREPGAKRWLTSLGFTIDPRTRYLYRWRA